MKYIGTIKTKSSSEIRENSLVSIGFECVDRDVINPQKCYKQLGISGIKYARCQTGWAKTEKEKGVYDFAWLDDMVDNLLAMGISPWFNVGFGNPLYMGKCPNVTGVGCVPLLYSEEVMDAWLRFVRRTVSHYRGRVHEYEIWNEPDIVHFWYPGEPDPALYAKFFQMTAEAIKAEDPTAKTGACFATISSAYTETFIRQLDKGYLDFICKHSYRTNVEDGTVEETAYLRKYLNRYGFEETRIWQGECGRASHFPENYRIPGQSSEHQQAVWQLRRFITELKCGVERISYFQIADMYERPYEMSSLVQVRPAAQGILNGLTYTPKKSFDTIRRLATVLSGEVRTNDNFFHLFIEGDPLRALSRETVSAQKNGSPMYFYWLPTYIEKECGVLGTANARLESATMKAPVVIDLFTGEVYETDFKREREDLLLLEKLPLAEYPMLICDKTLFEVNE